MSLLVSEQLYSVKNCEEFPRVGYFYRRLADINTRLQRIEEALPVCCQSNTLKTQLENLVTAVAEPINVLVISNRYIPGAFSVTRKSDTNREVSSPDCLQKGRVNIVVFVADVEYMKDNLEKTTQFLTEYVCRSGFKESFQPRHALLVICQVADDLLTSSERTELKSQIFTKLQPALGHCIELANIFVERTDANIRIHISDVLEDMLIDDGFIAIKVFLDKFVRKDQIIGVDLPSLREEKSLVYALQNALRNESSIADICQSIQSKDFSVAIRNHLAKTAKCAAVPVLGRKYGIPNPICYEILEEARFQENLVEDIGKNAIRHLQNLKVFAERIIRGETITKQTNCSFDFIAYILISDWEQVFARIERICASMSRLIAITKKMSFEIDGYLKQSRKYKDLGLQECSLPDELRRQLLAIEGIYGIGTVYGQLEIHIEQPGARENVISLLEKLNYKHPYAVKLVQTDVRKETQTEASATGHKKNDIC